MTTASELVAGGRCPTCGKVRYSSRAVAKKVMRRFRPRLPGHMSAYRCGAFWHVGHTPSALIRGNLTRSDLETS